MSDNRPTEFNVSDDNSEMIEKKRMEFFNQSKKRVTDFQKKIANNSLDENSSVERISRKDVSVSIHYVDAVGNKLADTEVVSGSYESPLDISWKTIDGYVLSSIRRFQRVFLPNPEGIFLIYTKQNSAPAVVYHKNSHGNLLSDPEYLRGELSEPYHAEPISDLENLVVDNSDNIDGTFEKKSATIEYIYETMQLEKFDIPDNFFIQVTGTVYPFSQPASNSQLEKKLPVESIWRVYRALREKTNGEVWLNLGGDIWIPDENIQIPNDIPESMQTAENTPEENGNNNMPINTFNVISDIPVEEHATVSIPDSQEVTIWDEPYGKFSKSQLKNGDHVYVSRQVQLENYSLWSQIQDGRFVEAQYLSFKEKKLDD